LPTLAEAEARLVAAALTERRQQERGRRRLGIDRQLYRKISEIGWVVREPANDSPRASERGRHW
jgi:hypothetical protein